MEETKIRNSKFSRIREDLFVYFCNGYRMADIAETYGIGRTRLYQIRDEDKWEERKREIDEKAKQLANKEYAITKSKIINLCDAILAAAGTQILQRIQKDSEDQYKFKVQDFVRLVKLKSLLVGEATEITGHIDVNSDTIKEIVHDMNPRERAAVVSLWQKIQDVKTKTKEEKENSLRLVE